jgi:CopG family transcriptional regulator, nickel-responsive regulator
MNNLYRFGISLEKELIQAFDSHIKKQKYHNRSEAIRDLIREALTRKQLAEGGVVAGAIVMTYDHHKRELVNTLLDIQHDFQDLIISTQHVHLDHHHCLEIIAVKGKAREIEKLADLIRSQVGVKQVSMSVASAGDH